MQAHENLMRNSESSSQMPNSRAELSYINAPIFSNVASKTHDRSLSVILRAA